MFIRDGRFLFFYDVDSISKLQSYTAAASSSRHPVKIKIQFNMKKLSEINILRWAVLRLNVTIMLLLLLININTFFFMEQSHVYFLF